MDVPVMIELRDHVGVKPDGSEVEYPQWIVLARVGGYFAVRKEDRLYPKQIGFLHRDGSVLAPISEWHGIAEQDKPVVLAELSRFVGREITCAYLPTIKELEAIA